ncbi:hypothetical protein B0J11DRAFT_84195 [Dendryphion nanum]|uniref:Uncharacterized protein n=1 Tax=Dendryphion nanum TaxID=256645 RepID=A0A9P9IFS2_9PLEO|nr:hypothetical protein B0J11DRAFT_84195 [Dendryphion nanum]
MVIESTYKLHWTQRIALVRHNLHAARRTGDYTFFKTLQAHALIDGTDHVVSLYSVLGCDADQVLSTLDNLNAGIAYVHQDAFKAVYDGAKSPMYQGESNHSSRRSLLRVDISQQRDMADHAIDKTTNSAVNLIEAQPAHCQDAVANAWIMGATIIADAVCVCLNEMEKIEEFADDFIHLEYSWNCIQNSVDAAISALRGIFNLMAASHRSLNIRSPSVSSVTVSELGSTNTRSRTSSTASAFGLIKRAFSHNQMHPPPHPKPTRAGSLPLPMPDVNSRGFRLSMSTAFPTRMPDHQHTLLTPVPPTPNVNEGPGNPTSPFKEKNCEYFSFNMNKDGNAASKESSISDSLMQLESLDPLYTPHVDELIKMPISSIPRRLSASFASPPSPIPV